MTQLATRQGNLSKRVEPGRAKARLPCRAAHGNNGTIGTRRGSNGCLKVESTVLRSEGTFSFSCADFNNELHELTVSLTSNGAGEYKYEWNKRISLSWMCAVMNAPCFLRFHKRKEVVVEYIYGRGLGPLRFFFFSLSFDFRHSILKLILKLKSKKPESREINGSPELIRGTAHGARLSHEFHNRARKEKKKKSRK